MIPLLSTISGQFTKNLILGSFLPVVIFVILNMIFVVPMFPPDWPLIKPFLSFGTEGRLIALSFVTIVLTGLLVNLNTPILRLYEGYPWRDSWIGQRMIRSKQNQLALAKAERLGIRTLLRELSTSDARYPALAAKRSRVALRVNNEFPSKKDLILPTRLGNVMRSFEEYPEPQYGIGAITLWSRLVAKIDKDYADGMDAAKTSADFMLNVSVLSSLSAALITIVGLYYFAPILTVLLTGLGFMAVGYLAYAGLIGRAAAWGAMVKGAFDLYRGDLLKQLGYDRPNLTLKEERSLWKTISRQLIYGDSPWGRDPLMEFRLEKTFARSAAPFVDLQIARGVQVDTNGSMTITINVRNTNSKDKSAKRVRIIETIPNDFNYVWGSARYGGESPGVVGTNPYTFEIGDIPPREQVTLSYVIVPNPKK